MANSLEYVQSITSDRTELDARYERINQTWADSEIPDFVLSTPDWQSGWEVLLGWVSRHVSGTDWPWPPQDRRPLTNARWSNEVHIFSHMINRRRRPQRRPRCDRGRRHASDSRMVE